MSDEQHPDELDGIFEHLTPEDFVVSTSAVAEVVRDNPGPFSDRFVRSFAIAFNAFVDEQVRAVRTSWVASQTFMQPIAILVNRGVQRIFTPEEDETLGDFVNRLHREAVSMEATWVFLSKRTEVAYNGDVEEDRTDVPDIDDPDAWAEAQAAGRTALGVYWFAEARIGEQRWHRHGQMTDDMGVLDEGHEGSPQQSIPLLQAILGT